MGGREVEKRMLVMKYNESDNLPYCGEYLSVNFEKRSVTGIVAQGKNLARNWLFKGCLV